MARKGRRGVGFERDRSASRLAADVSSPLAGEPHDRGEAEERITRRARAFKVHLDGFNLLPYLTGEEQKSGATGIHLLQRRRRSSSRSATATGSACSWSSAAQGTLEIWGEPFTPLRIPKLYNLRTDPFERADVTSNTYWDWYISKGYMIMAAQALVSAFIETFKEFPPRQKAASFTIDQAMEKMESSMAGAGH